MNDPFLLEEVIRFSDCDPAGICYFGRFSTFFDESFIAAARQEGLGWEEHEKINFLIPIVETNTRFFSPLKAGDIAKIYAGITKIGNRSFRSSHVITIERNGKEKLVAKGFIARVTVDYHDFKPKPIPDELRKAIQKYQFSESEWEEFASAFS